MTFTPSTDPSTQNMYYHLIFHLLGERERRYNLRKQQQEDAIVAKVVACCCYPKCVYCFLFYIKYVTLILAIVLFSNYQVEAKNPPSLKKLLIAVAIIDVLLFCSCAMY